MARDLHCDDAFDAPVSGVVGTGAVLVWWELVLWDGELVALACPNDKPALAAVHDLTADQAVEKAVAKAIQGDLPEEGERRSNRGAPIQRSGLHGSLPSGYAGTSFVALQEASKPFRPEGRGHPEAPRGDRSGTTSTPREHRGSEQTQAPPYACSRDLGGTWSSLLFLFLHLLPGPSVDGDQFMRRARSPDAGSTALQDEFLSGRCFLRISPDRVHAAAMARRVNRLVQGQDRKEPY